MVRRQWCQGLLNPTVLSMTAWLVGCRYFCSACQDTYSILSTAQIGCASLLTAKTLGSLCHHAAVDLWPFKTAPKERVTFFV